MPVSAFLPAAFLFGAAYGSAVPRHDSTATALFAGGSFWCLEAALETVPGVDSAEAGYVYAGTDSAPPAPSFDAVVNGGSGYVEAVRVSYRPTRAGYGRILDAYFRNIDPTRADGQFTDAGPEYRTLIFWSDAAQKQAAEKARKRLAGSKRFAKPIVTEVKAASPFFRAEREHQDYARRNAVRYKAY